MNKITNWFKGYFGTKDDEDETFEVEEEKQSNSSRSRTDFSRPLILDEDELEAYGVSYDEPKPVKSTHQVNAPKKDEEIVYYSTEIISPFHGLKKEGAEHKERPKSRPSSSQKKDQTIISPYFGAVKKEETKTTEVKEGIKEDTKLNTQEIKLNIKFDEDEYPETFDELRDWYREDDEK